MIRSLRWFVILWAVYTIFAQPGLPSCWLERIACESHPHPDGHPERPHSHQYLFDDMQAAGAAIPEQVVPAQLILSLLQQINITWNLHQPTFSIHAWSAATDPPPPR
jgi:hypothetical protein